MLGPKTENAITDGDNNTQVGHNSGSITVGLTFEQHKQALKEALEEKTADLERAHGAERQILQNQISETQKRLENIEADYEATVAELTRVKALLSRYDNQIDQQKRNAAFAAIDQGETTLAQALLKELSKRASERRDDAAKEEAEFEFELGKLAEGEIRWHDAYTHYKRAADLHDDMAHLKAYARMTWKLAKGEEAIEVHRKLHARAKSEFGEISAEFASQTNDLGEVLRMHGHYKEAEVLFRKVLEIDRATIGEWNQNHAKHLNNLALAVKAQGRYEEAEGLYRQALEIDRATIGEGQPSYAIHLNNLARVVEAQGRYEEAEDLYRQALEIDRATIGEGHPTYATHLSNLGNNLAMQGKVDQARPILDQALTILRAPLPAGHPDIEEVLRRIDALPPE